ncbi:hypothetical protein [Chitinophaga sp. S165]|uniref:hypothetical protein n=1 Tax=Chitinophaga sp. S165 TaxID=2135462 RepID=UPI000D718DE9|nr:hypothetical protein [Chitinophaga sp. S165]PWV47126.1 hypothetical protein C7475_109214 [Chitinophaga sp. S165]
MKKLFLIPAIAAVAACSQDAARSAKAVSGTYAREFVHQFGTLRETVIITPSSSGVLQFEVRELSQHLDTAAKPGMRKRPTEKRYHGQYDPAQHMLDLGSDGLKYYFNANGDTLRSGSNVFIKR